MRQSESAPAIANALDFLTILHSKGLSFSSINTARSALLSFCNFEGLSAPFRQIPVVKHFMEGVS